MENGNLNIKLQVAMKQRNILSYVSGALLLISLLLVIKLMISERVTIIVPSHISNAYEISDQKVSSYYLEDIAKEVIFTFLNVTPGSVDFAVEQILEMVEPSYYGELSKDLYQISKDVSRRKVSTTFYPLSMEVNEELFTVNITGELHTYVGKKRTGKEKKSYYLRFKYSSGRLLINEFYEVKDDDNE